MLKRFTTFHLTIAIFCFSLLLVAAKPAIYTGILQQGAVSVHINHPKIKPTHGAFKLDFGIPAYNRFLGLDFRAHDHASRNEPNYQSSTKNKNPYMQAELYHHTPYMRLFFKWAKNIPSDIAAATWALINLFGIFFASFFWLELARKHTLEANPILKAHTSFLLATLFTFSYPSLFAFERGGSDIHILLLISLTAYGLLKDNWMIATLCILAGSIIKIYPSFTCIAFFILGLSALIMHKHKSNRYALKLGKTILTCLVGGTLLAVLPIWKDQWYFVTQIMTSTEMTVNPAHISHSLTLFWGRLGWLINLGLWVVFAACFTQHALLLLKFKESSVDKQDDVILTYGIEAQQLMLLSFALLCAIMMYFSPISFDYNLIMLIPLIALCTAIDTKKNDILIKVGLALILIGFTAPRWLNDFLLRWAGLNGHIFMLCEILGLTFLAAYVSIRTIKFKKVVESTK